jgi:hypothetical protein
VPDARRAKPNRALLPAVSPRGAVLPGGAQSAAAAWGPRALLDGWLRGCACTYSCVCTGAGDSRRTTEGLALTRLCTAQLVRSPPRGSASGTRVERIVEVASRPAWPRVAGEGGPRHLQCYSSCFSIAKPIISAVPDVARAGAGEDAPPAYSAEALSASEPALSKLLQGAVVGEGDLPRLPFFGVLIATLAGKYRAQSSGRRKLPKSILFADPSANAHEEGWPTPAAQES